jgi:hydrogenase-4 component F
VTPLALILVPAVAGAACFLIRPDRARRLLLLAAAVAHAGLTARAWSLPLSVSTTDWLAIGPTALYFLSLTSALFLAVSVYTVGYLARERAVDHTDAEEDFVFTNSPEAVFTACLLFFLSSMTLVITSQHVGLLWVAVEATTLASAPLITFHRHHRSLEATWKYLLICSVGIALALLGNFFLAIAASFDGTHQLPLTVAELVADAPKLHPVWLKAAFVLFLVGYGTKMGLVPLHTWLPDAHSEAPSPVSALLSGALLNCAFLAILRLHSILEAAGLGGFSGSLLAGFGVLSVVAAAAFLVRQTDYKRMLAYSSVENMGLLALGAGLGGAGGFAALLHAGNHTMAKGMLFLAAGNILAGARSKAVAQATGLRARMPATATLWIAGLLAITGMPPSALFVSKLLIVRRAFEAGRYGIAGLTLFALAMAFAGMTAVALRMVYAKADAGPPASPPAHAGADAAAAPAHASGAGAVAAVAAPAVAHASEPRRVREPWSSLLPPVALGLIVLLLGVTLPAPLARLISQAAAQLGVDR